MESVKNVSVLFSPKERRKISFIIRIRKSRVEVKAKHEEEHSIECKWEEEMVELLEQKYVKIEKDKIEFERSYDCI